MRIVAVVLLIVAQFTVFPFFGRISMNTVRQFHDARHDNQDAAKARATRSTLISKTAAM